MRYYVLPREGLTDDMRAALAKGLGLSPRDVFACERHCLRYGVQTVDAFVEELEEAQAVLATAKLLGAVVMVDWRGSLCYELLDAPDDGSTDQDAEVWRSDAWLSALFGEARLS